MKVNRFLLYIALLLLVVFNNTGAIAQDSIRTKKYYHGFVIETGGLPLLPSLGYQFFFKTEKKNLGASLQLSYFGASYSAAVDFSMGWGQRRVFETGLGSSITSLADHSSSGKSYLRLYFTPIAYRQFFPIKNQDLIFIRVSLSSQFYATDKEKGYTLYSILPGVTFGMVF